MTIVGTIGQKPANRVVMQALSGDALRERIAELRAASRSATGRRGRKSAAWHRLFADMDVGEQIVLATNCRNEDDEGKFTVPKFASVKNFLTSQARKNGHVFLVFGTPNEDGSGEMIVIRTDDDPSRIVVEEEDDSEGDDVE